MKFNMNIYYNLNDLVRKRNNDITKNVLNRFEENDFADLYNRLDSIEDEDLADRLAEFLKNATSKDLEEYITVDEDSIKYDDNETSECDCRTVAYLVNVDFNVDKFSSDKQNPHLKNMNDLKGLKVTLDNGKKGIIINALTKEETKQCKMYGQLIWVQLEDGTIEEHCYGYSIDVEKHR